MFNKVLKTKNILTKFTKCVNVGLVDNVHEHNWIHIKGGQICYLQALIWAPPR